MFEVEILKEASKKAAEDIGALTGQISLTKISPKPISEQELADLVGQNHLNCLVVRDKDRIIGIVVLYFTRIPSGLIAEAEDLIVDEEYRKWGVGPLLIQKAVEIAETKGAKHISLRTNPARVEANKMYDALGFQKKETNFYRINLPRK